MINILLLVAEMKSSENQKKKLKNPSYNKIVKTRFSSNVRNVSKVRTTTAEIIRIAYKTATHRRRT